MFLLALWSVQQFPKSAECKVEKYLLERQLATELYHAKHFQFLP